MLIRDHYLDTEALENYIAALEQGLLESGTSRTGGHQGFGGSIGVPYLGIEAKQGSESENTRTYRDHHAARLKRLIQAGQDQAEIVGWTEVTQPDLDFEQAGIGALLHWECDVYVPELIATISGSDGFTQALDQLKHLQPAAERLGLSMEGLPDIDEMDAMATFLQQADTAPVVVGESSDTDWRIAGTLRKEHIATGAQFDGPARIIGKVTKRVSRDRWYPLMALPGMQLIPREERRRLERTGPKDNSEEEQFLRGPLLIVNYLSIYT